MHQSDDGKKELIHSDWGYGPDISSLISLDAQEM